MEVFGAEDVSERGLGQHPRAVMTVLNIGHGDRCVRDSEEHDRVNRHSNTVLGQDLNKISKIS